MSITTAVSVSAMAVVVAISVAIVIAIVSVVVAISVAVVAAVISAVVCVVIIVASVPSIPGAGSDEDSTDEPARSVVAIGGARVRCVRVISPSAYGRRTINGNAGIVNHIRVVDHGWRGYGDSYAYAYGYLRMGEGHRKSDCAE
jgi:hypothetical protein